MDVRDRLIEAVEKLSPSQQEDVLRYVDKISLPTGAGPETWQKFIGCIDDESARQMMEAIEEECERIDLDTW